MDPSYDSSEPAPDNEQQHTPKRKKVIVASVIIAVLLLVALVTAALFTRAAIREEAVEPTDPKTRIDRAGYTNVHESIGDPFALQQKTTETVAVYQNAPVIDACNLLTLEAVTKQNLFISPGVDAGKISRHFFDGGSTAIDKEWLGSDELARDLNECDYPLIATDGKSNGNLHIEVYQPTYASAAGLRSELDDYLRSSETIDGVDVYNRTNTPIEDERTFYFLEYKGTYVGVEFAVHDADKNTGRILLESVAKHFKATSDKPAGPAEYSFESPTFDGTFIGACKISAAEDAKSLFKQPANPSVHERIAPSTGILKYDGKRENYVNNHCIRTTSGGEAKTFTVEASSYESEKGAAAALARLKNSGSVDVEKVGDEAFFNKDNSPRNALYFRAGATVITLAVNDGVDKIEEEYIEQLSPIAENVIKRIAAITNPAPATPHEESAD